MDEILKRYIRELQKHNPEKFLELAQEESDVFIIASNVDTKNLAILWEVVSEELSSPEYDTYVKTLVSHLPKRVYVPEYKDEE